MYPTKKDYKKHICYDLEKINDFMLTDLSDICNAKKWSYRKVLSFATFEILYVAAL